VHLLSGAIGLEHTAKLKIWLTQTRELIMSAAMLCGTVCAFKRHKRFLEDGNTRFKLKRKFENTT